MTPAGRGRGRRGVARPGFFSALCAVAASCASASAVPPGNGATPDDELAVAVYTSEQATHGQRLFSTVCATCHGPNEFTGPIFGLTWRVEPVGHLFEHIRTAMPQDSPGSLSDEEYAAIVAYFLRLNGRPAGERELAADSGVLDRTRW